VLTAPNAGEGVLEAPLGVSSIPSGQIRVSFDVYDKAGNRNLAPHGVRQGLIPERPSPSIQFMSQRDTSWSDDLLGDSLNHTIGGQGCVITCLAMLFNFYQPNFATPRSLNESLRDAEGFLGPLVIWSALAEVAPPGIAFRGNDSSWAHVDNELAAGHPVLARVVGSQTPGHEVLIMSKNGDKYTLFDPWAPAGSDGRYTWPGGELTGGGEYDLIHFRYIGP
jgi:hypothetical protein